jgi:hypothetical protein
MRGEVEADKGMEKMGGNVPIGSPIELNKPPLPFFSSLSSSFCCGI